MHRFLAYLSIFAAALGAQSFVNDVKPMLTKAGCMGCHQGNGVASTTRLVFPDPDVGREWEAFGVIHYGRSWIVRSGKSLLAMKPTNRTAHAGGV
ncbi:MAG: hypothetical protein R2762_14655 [Bryobacteraceae bacterium]